MLNRKVTKIGRTDNYLWILGRTPKISDELYDNLVDFAASKGFDISKIIKVAQ